MNNLAKNNYGFKWLAFNSKFDRALCKSFLNMPYFKKPVLDTMAFQFLLDENRLSLPGSSLNLKYVVRNEYQYNGYQDEEILKARNDGALASVNLFDHLNYVGEDGYVTRKLFTSQCKAARWQNYEEKALALLEYFYDPLYKLFVNMETNGIFVDLPRLRDLKSNNRSVIKQRMWDIEKSFKKCKNIINTNKLLMQEKAKGLSPLFGDPWHFDINKTDHKRKLFFNILDLDIVNPSKELDDDDNPYGKLDKDFQEKYKNIKEVAMYSDYQGLKKLQSSYVNSIWNFLQDEPDCQDGCVRPSFSGTGTRTGRGKARNPNCLTKDTYISTEKGLIEIKELCNQEEDIKVKSRNTINIATNYLETRLNTYKLNTRYGREIKGSYDHPLLVFTQNLNLKFKKIKDIKLGDYLVFDTNYLWPKTNYKYKDTKLNKYLAEFMGLICSDGTIIPKSDKKAHSVYFSAKNKDIINRFKILTKKCFNIEFYKYLGKSDAWVFYSGDKKVLKILKDLGMTYRNYGTKTHHTRVVPKSIMRSPKKVVQHFIAGYTDGDRSLGDNVRIHSASKKMLTQISILLQGMGIIISLGKSEGTILPMYQLTACGEDARLFVKIIPTVKKCNLEVEEHRSYTWYIPYFQQWMKDNLKKYKVTKDGLKYKTTKGEEILSFKANDTKAKVFTHNYLKINSEIVYNFKKINPNKYKSIKEILDNNYFFSQVTSKKKLGKKKVYDFEVKNIHSFIANGIVSHNSMQTPRGDTPEQVEIRKLYRVAPGYALLYFDVMTAEVRVWGQSSGDDVLCDIFRKGMKLRTEYRKNPNPKLKEKAELQGDFHTMTAAEAYEVKPAVAKRKYRQGTKSVSLGKMYGRSNASIGEQINKSPKEVKEIEKRVFGKYVKGNKWFDTMEKFGEKHIYVESQIGRRRRLYGFLTDDFRTINEAKRNARNSPIQGYSSDLAYLGTHLIDEEIRIKNYDWEVKNTVHDSGMVQVPIKDLRKAAKVVEHQFNVKLPLYIKEKFNVDLILPIEVEFEFGTNLGNLCKWDFSKKDFKRLYKYVKNQIKKDLKKFNNN